MHTKIPTLITLGPDRMSLVGSNACDRLIADHFEVTSNRCGRDLTTAELKSLVTEDVELIVTSWGSPPITEDVLGRAPALRAIAHATGSIKQLVPDSMFARGIVVISAAPRIADVVAEYCLAGVFHWLGRLWDYDQSLRRTGWDAPGVPRRHELRGQRVGVVSASMTGRRFIRLVQACGAHVVVYDPILSTAEAQSLEVTLVSLEEVMTCPVISVHAPAIPATQNLLNSELVGRIPDGAIFINSARGAVVDQAALTRELARQRFFAVLDVYEAEPLPKPHPLRQLDNVLLTPHIAGYAAESDRSLLEFVLRGQ